LITSTDTLKNTTNFPVNQLTREDNFDIVCLCHAALAQDSPNPPEFYINQIMNYHFACLTSLQKDEVETYLAEKKYLPPAPKIEIAK
tara:strand:- start:32 stop:292 length:261 start_codon:yes stop_codon:yes gene_type:complete